MILVNFKTYPEATGGKGVALTHILCDVAGETGVEIISCPQAVDLREVARASDHPVWAQHVDPIKRGQATGWFPPEVAKEAGAEGVLLNHSEHKLEWETLQESHKRAKEVGLTTLVFADSLEEAKKVASLSPDWIGYEPPELIASPTTSVARSKPDVIEEVVKAISNIPILVGAGIKDAEDVRVSLERGARAVGLSSALILSEDPRKVALDLTEGFK